MGAPSPAQHQEQVVPSNKLRIAIVAENFLPKVDGVTRTIARLLEYIQREGHEAILFVPKTQMPAYAGQPIADTFGVPLLFYPELQLGFVRPYFFSRLKEFRPDVIHFVDPNFLGAQFLLAAELGFGGVGPWTESGVGFVTSYHTNMALYTRMFALSCSEYFTWLWLRWLHNKCQAVYAPSPSMASALVGRKFTNVEVWSRGTDCRAFGARHRSMKLRERWARERRIHGSMEDIAQDGASISNEQVVLMYAGRLSREKNLLFLLTAVSLLPRSLNYKLVLVGHGPYRTFLEEFCAERRIDAHFAGHQSGEDLARHYASADVFCFPSFTETFGQVVSEALTSGLPVVGLEVEGTRDLVTHGVTGLLLPQSSASWGPLFAHPWSPQFADAARRYAELLMLLICDPQWRRTMGANAAREAAGRGTWGDAMEQLFLGYRRAIEEAKSRKGAEPACGHWMNSTRRVCVRSVSTTLIFLLTAVAIALCWMRNLAWIVILDAIARCRPGNRQ